MRKNIIVTLIAALLLCMFLGGCEKEKRTGEYQIFYLNMDVTKIVPKDYSTDKIEAAELVEEFLDALATQPDSGDLRNTIPSSVSVNDYSLNGYLVTIDFSESYYDMTATEEVLCRAAVVRTLLQVENVTFVTFTVEGQPLVDGDGKVISRMNADSFVENPGQQINTSNSTTLTLYFADSKGTALEKETRVVHYSTNISLEKLVIEQLLEGPKTSGLQSAIPADTKLITISVVDGVCYVNLDETFQNQKDEITEQVVLYSIVNSLTELPNVNKVQLSINGETSGKVRYTFDLSKMYEEDLSLVVEEPETETEESTENDTEKTDVPVNNVMINPQNDMNSEGE